MPPLTEVRRTSARDPRRTAISKPAVRQIKPSHIKARRYWEAVEMTSHGVAKQLKEVSTRDESNTQRANSLNHQRKETATNVFPEKRRMNSI
jgi:hypothetical protein